VIPPGDCHIRVLNQQRGWVEGRVLVLEDSFVHRAWNATNQTRGILIADFWHPDLTDIEVRALTAILMKSEVRMLLQATRSYLPGDVLARVVPILREEDRRSELIRDFWPTEPAPTHWDGLAYPMP
jgi:hypothetical protein